MIYSINELEAGKLFKISRDKVIGFSVDLFNLTTFDDIENFFTNIKISDYVLFKKMI